MPTLEERIEGAFSTYQPTIELLSELMNSKRNIQEFVLLVCARLDSLSNLAYSGRSQKDSFYNFVVRYSGFGKTFEAISLPDLYYFLNYQLWRLPGTIRIPGRLQLFDLLRDERFITFIWESDLAITVEEIGGLLKFILRVIREHYRVTPTQSKQKECMDRFSVIYECLSSSAQEYRKGMYQRAIEGIKPVLKDFSLANILYREFRSGVIHEYRVGINEAKFFSQTEVYWRTTYNQYVEPGKFLDVQFPAPFLFNTLTNSIQGYKVQLQKTRKLPSSIFNEICDLDSEIQYLDLRSIPDLKDVKISIRSGNHYSYGNAQGES